MTEQFRNRLNENFKETLADRVERESSEFHELKMRKNIAEFDFARFSLNEIKWEDSCVFQDGNIDRIGFQGTCIVSGTLYWYLKDEFRPNKTSITNERVTFHAFASGSNPLWVNWHQAKFERIPL